MGLLSAVVGVAGSLIGARMQNSASSRLMEQSAGYSREGLQNRHQWEVEDLRKAGLNPILSATNSAGGGMNVGAPAGAGPDLTKALEQISNSALARKETELAQYKADTDRIKAQADLIRAEQDKARTSSAIELNTQSASNQMQQAKLAVKQTEMLDKNYELQKIYTMANVKEIDQRIINSVAEVKAKVQYLADAGAAELRKASAAESAAGAAWASAQAQQVIAQVAEQNGISQRQLNEALSGKASAETKEAYERAQNLATGRQVTQSHNPIAFPEKSQPGWRVWLGLGEILSNGVNGAAGFLK